MTASLRDRIREFITRELLVDSAIPLTDEMPLIDEGLIDSMGVFSLATWLETEFGIDVQDRDLVPSNFGSIVDLARFVEERRRGGSGA